MEREGGIGRRERGGRRREEREGRRERGRREREEGEGRRERDGVGETRQYNKQETISHNS